MSAQELLTRESAIEQLMLPTGQRFGIEHVPQTGLYRLKYIAVVKAGKVVPMENQSVPEKLGGKYTKRELAIEACRAFLGTVWDENDEAALRAAGKARAKQASAAE